MRRRSVDDVEEHVRGVVAVREVADLIDDEHVQVSVLGDGFAETAMPASHRELLDERRGGDEERVEAVLGRPVGDRYRQVRLPPARLAGEDERASLRDEVGGEKYEPMSGSRTVD